MKLKHISTIIMNDIYQAVTSFHIATFKELCH